MKKLIYAFGLMFAMGIYANNTVIAQYTDEYYCPMHDIEEPESTFKVTSTCDPVTDICKGRYKPGKGVLKALFVYIRFADDNASMSYWNTYPNSSDIYDVEPWMANSIDETTTENSDNYFNISNYFSEVSRDSFNVIGEAVYIELPSKSTFTDDGTPTGTPLEDVDLMFATNLYALEHLDARMDLSEYDNFDYVGDFHHDQVSDGLIDMVYMIYRTPGEKHFAGHPSWGAFGGVASLGYWGTGIQTLPSGVKANFSPLYSGSGLTIHLGTNRVTDFDVSYIHELAHYIMGGNHPYTDDSYRSTIGGTGYWGVFGGNFATNSINSYEQEKLGWITVPELTTTSLDSLDDFITTGEAFKYIIGTNEYYYFENRQRIQSTTGLDNSYDQPNWNDDDKGIFVLHVKENSGGNYLYQEDNSLESIVSDGNWDWNLTDFEDVCNDSGEPAFEKNSPNRFGESFKDPIMIVDNPGDTKGPYKQSLFVKSSASTICKKYFLGYDSTDKSGFTETSRSLITPYTNPAFLSRSKSQIGIGLQITSKTGNTLHFKFFSNTHNHYTVAENTTWDRQIFLDNSLTVQSGAKLTIKPNTTVYVEDAKAINVYGELDASGVEFIPMNSTWNGITFHNGSNGESR